MRDSDYDLWCKALQGDAVPLLEYQPEGAVADVAPSLNSVFIVTTDPDGAQHGTVALAGPGGAPVFGAPEIPQSFRVERIEHDDTHWTLHAADGRTLRATPGQFANQPPLIAEDHNPCYQAHLEQSWDAIARVYAHDAPDRPVPEISDEVLGDFEFDEDLYQYSATFEHAPNRTFVCFGAAEPERIRELLPSVRALLKDYERVHKAGLQYLWDHRPEAEPWEGTEAAFFSKVFAFRMDIYYSGDFILNYSDANAGFFADGSWMAVHFRGENATPVMLSVEG